MAASSHFTGSPSSSGRLSRPPAHMGAPMFGLLNGFKYRREVLVQTHAILNFVPELAGLLKTFPTLKNTIKQLRKEGVPEAEAASLISLLVLERVMVQTSMQDRTLTLGQLREHADDEFRFFSQLARGLSDEQGSEYPEGMPILTMATGFSLWYIGFLFREKQLSQRACDVYMADLAGMLLGKSDEERRRHRLRIATRAPQTGA